MSNVMDKPRTWGSFHERWAQLKPPLRPNLEVVEAFGHLLTHHDEKVLLLGVTPEFADLGQHTTALERVPETIEFIWPGNTERRQAVLGNWLAPELSENQFTAVIGDGVLSCLPFSSYTPFFEQMNRLLTPEGILLIRLYLSPDQGESIEAVRAQTLAGKIKHFHAFKWMLAMAMGFETGRPDIAVSAIHQVFEREFPDRAALEKATGWSQATINEIDAYHNANYVFSFPTAAQVLTQIPPHWKSEFIPAGSYPLAERCPLLQLQVAQS